METVIGVEVNNEGDMEESGGATKSTSFLSSPKQVADPVVYKLVRVEGDGRLVPATEDEIMEVEGLLLDEKGDIHMVDAEQTGGCISNEGSFSGIPHVESSEGFSHSGNTEADAELLNTRIELQSEIIMLETLPHMELGSDDKLINEPRSVGECSDSLDELAVGGSSASFVRNSSKPDFSKLQGEICLDDMSIRELHETFMATFGRETSVKDKLWLKRRIAMGLTNSCDISTTTFIIKDNKLVNEGKDASGNDVGEIITKDSAPGGSDMEDDQFGFGNEQRNHNLDSNYGDEGLDTDQGSKKRIRKPTKRYIEEEESKENIGRLAPSSKNSIDRQVSPTSHVRPVRNVLSNGRAIVTRFDSLGGSVVHVPYVCRVRRSRPRKDVTSLMQFHSGGIGTTTDALTKDICVQGSQLDNANGSQVLEASASREQIQPSLIVETDNNEQLPVSGDGQVEQHTEEEQVETSGDTTAIVPTSKGGIRRKHHRAWTLTEVMKLVEGVSRYGAGRWSEIKRLAFSSSPYRTSVDLKDKWRNLLKASFVQTPSDKGMNSRKQASSVPIPATILLRVRELAEMQSQAPPILSSATAKPVGGGKSVNETRSGYL